MFPSKHIQTVTLQKIRLACQSYISPESLSLEIVQDYLSSALVATLRAEIASEHLDRQTVTYPLNWKEAVKERLYQWLGTGWNRPGHWPLLGDYCRTHWPVQYRVVHIDVNALYPKISLPRERNSIVVTKVEDDDLDVMWIDMRNYRETLLQALNEIHYRRRAWRNDDVWRAGRRALYDMKRECYDQFSLSSQPLMGIPESFNGIQIKVDTMLPDDVIELRDAGGNIIGKIFNVGRSK